MTRKTDKQKELVAFANHFKNLQEDQLKDIISEELNKITPETKTKFVIGLKNIVKEHLRAKKVHALLNDKKSTLIDFQQTLVETELTPLFVHELVGLVAYDSQLIKKKYEDEKFKATSQGGKKRSEHYIKIKAEIIAEWKTGKYKTKDSLAADMAKKHKINTRTALKYLANV